MNQILDYLFSAIPSLQDVLLWSPISVVCGVAYFQVAGWLHDARQWKIGYTRKVVHVLICSSAFLLQATQGFPVLCLFGGWIGVVLLYVVLRGDRTRMYRGIARPADHPHERYYILVPSLATLIGGGLSNFLFPQVALVGYLVTGLGDAVGEPVGTRWGRHRYRVPTLTGITSYRSIEGSAAVMVVSMLAAWIALSTLGSAALLPVLVIGVGACLIEAISPHGWDNATLQLLPSALAWWFLRAAAS